ncbi:insulin-related peptide 2-like [Maniola jurtina]|uniref:insulin-related peptide 2-like n=1 Tax=Maniola jurtina TaxID=191418 RepID=UPI001E689D7A|nr:insulin-related peptide 2-like [Maniola jurtina]XP_045763439.1 insulin-related peptide 2-like [Maniola jurtina]
MSYQRSLTVFSLMMLVALSCAHIGGNSLLYQDVRPQYYCGRSLARVIALICFDELSSEKRSEAGTMYNAILSPYYKEQENHIGWPWIPIHKARGLGLPSRGKRFVVSECCDKACSIEELLSYCS